jgi:hypothetical protein
MQKQDLSKLQLRKVKGIKRKSDKTEKKTENSNKKIKADE